MSKKQKAGDLNIVLTGFMATGKTAVGKKLAGRLNRRFVDTDRVVEKSAGMRIRAIFEQCGESYFRDLESEAVAGLDIYPAGSLVVATGGGVLIREENRKKLKKHGLLILLTAAPQTIIKRLDKRRERPLLNVSDPEEKVKTLLEEREHCYRICEAKIDTTAKSIDGVVEEIMAYLLLR